MLQPTTEKEQEWLRQLKLGKQDALQSIFKQYYKYLLVTAINITNDQVIAKDLVQDVFFEIWKKREQLSINSSFKAYLRKAVVNRALNFLKKNKRFDWGEEHFDAQTPAKEISAQQQLETNDLQQLINQAINQLPPKCKVIFTLSRFEKFTHKEIAAQLDISTKTIENQITKALKIIRIAVESYNKLVIFLGCLFI